MNYNIYLNWFSHSLAALRFTENQKTLGNVFSFPLKIVMNGKLLNEVKFGKFGMFPSLPQIKWWGCDDEIKTKQLVEFEDFAGNAKHF